MEDTLGVSILKNNMIQCLRVLILIVMEDTLGVAKKLDRDGDEVS